MNREKDPHRYDDMLLLERPVSRRHPPMPLLDRAAQFAPFAALTGYEAIVKEAARQTQTRVELEEDERELLDRSLQQLQECLRMQGEQPPLVRITWFVPDQKKQGGSYQEECAAVKRIDFHAAQLVLLDGRRIPMEEIVRLSVEQEREDWNQP